jgi:hypothetical protein
MTKLIPVLLLSFLAATPATSATRVEMQEIRGYALNADLSDLTDLEVSMLLQIIHGPDREGKKYRQVRAFLLHRDGRLFINKLFK